MKSAEYSQAVRFGNRDEVAKIVTSEALNNENQSGQNLLQESIASKNFEVADWLIEQGINVNHQDQNGQTPLHYAALYGVAPIAEKIFSQGGKLNLVDIHGNSPLWTAVFNAKGEYSLVRLFLRHGGDPRQKNKKGRSPLDFARQIEDDDLVRILETAG